MKKTIIISILLLIGFCSYMTLKEGDVLGGRTPVYPTSATEVIASSTAIIASSGNPIPNGLEMVTIKAITGSSDYINLPNVIATGTSVWLYTSGDAISLKTASSTTGDLQKINNGTASATASSSIPADTSRFCNLQNNVNWQCMDYNTAGTASSSAATN